MSELVYTDKNLNIAKYVGRKGYRESYQIETRDGHFFKIEFIDEGD